ncbi:MAG TPA: RNA polymerase sigma factor FliA [Gammaproteobacteria bacterium]
MYADEAAMPGEALVARYMDLVRRIAFHMAGRLPASVQVEDLIQAGVVGLLEAGRYYDRRHGASFETYAGIRIRGAMLDEVRRQNWAPRSAHRATRQIAEAIRAVEGRTGREAQAEEVARELGVSLDVYHDMVRKVTEARVLSLDALFEPDGDYTEMLPDDADDPSQQCVKDRLLGAAAEAIDGLPERERLVLSLYYVEELNLKEIGQVLGVTESRVCQIHGQALARLRARLTDWRDEERAK